MRGTFVVVEMNRVSLIFAFLSVFSVPALAQNKSCQGLFSPTPLLLSQLRFPENTNLDQNPKDFFQYGFEIEYVLNESGALLKDYIPPVYEHNLTVKKWTEDLTDEQRVDFVKKNLKALFPETKKPGKLILRDNSPLKLMVNSTLILDETGNLEIVSKVANSLEEVKHFLGIAFSRYGAGSAQLTLSLPRSAFFNKELATNVGFFKFLHDQDTLNKLVLGFSRYKTNLSEEVAKSFNHSHLGPMTLLRQKMLEQYLMLNSQGLFLDGKPRTDISNQQYSFKYIGGSVYRPDITKARVLIETRDAHKNLKLLFSRVERNTQLLSVNRDVFASAASLLPFDPEISFEKLPPKVKEMLITVFPNKLKSDLTYLGTELESLSVYRNFAWPLRDWTGHFEFLKIHGLKELVAEKQQQYVKDLESIANLFYSNALDSKSASVMVQGALAKFAAESALSDAFNQWLEKQSRIETK
ncbi:MAG: hypothetical protein A4S09_03260 [Proteobacteria bacterium SG_bin7]|nr:MAG: hypothetical protein A4S09_03260 [Proteobacteria bacterium SG_bin7]